MKKLNTCIALIGASLLGGISPANAADTSIGDLQIAAPAIRATLPNQPVAGGFMTITNTGSQSDRLIGGSAAFASDVQIHEMAVENDVMKMRELADGLEIPAGGSVELKPGGYHVMFMQLGEAMEDGQTRKVKLTFEKAGEVEVEFDVREMRPAMKKMDMKKMKHDHKG